MLDNKSILVYSIDIARGTTPNTKEGQPDG